MSDLNNIITLKGCNSHSLMSYMKSLGVSNVLNKILPQTLVKWRGNTLQIKNEELSTIHSLVQTIAENYKPSPVLAPWNGGSGFYKKWEPKNNSFRSRDAVDTLESIRHSTSVRFEAYRHSIQTTIEALTKFSEAIDIEDQIDSFKKIGKNEGWSEKQTSEAIEHFLDSSFFFESDDTTRTISKANKDEWLLLLRSYVLDDTTLKWLDSAIVLAIGEKKNRMEAPLLGSGGNISNSDFSFRFMKMLMTVLPLAEVDPLPGKSLQHLTTALFDENCDELEPVAVDQFDPGRAGGFNMGVGFKERPLLNPWDYIFMIEGALLLSGSAARRLRDRRTASVFPFSVNSSTVGSGTNTLDETRGEVWLPMWSNFSTVQEIQAILGEGRSQVGSNTARTGIDFFTAITNLGVDRGISHFSRIQFQKRLGDNYLATNLGTYRVGEVPAASIIFDILDWLDRFRRAATGKNASGRSARVLRLIETVILKLCQRGTTAEVQSLLIALGEAEATVAISKSLKEGEKGNGIRPVPLLSADWLKKAYDGSIEFRLAAALASISHTKVGPFRRHLEPLDHATWKTAFLKWADEDNDPSLVWGGGDLIHNLSVVLQRRIVDIMKSGKEGNQSNLLAPLSGRLNASLGDISQFIAGTVDDQRIESLLKGLILVDWSNLSTDNRTVLRGPHTPVPNAAYSLLKLCHLSSLSKNTSIRLDPRISRLAIAGKISEATQLASRRLRASGFQPALDEVYLTGEVARRTTAALVFPVNQQASEQLFKHVIRRDKLGVTLHE